MVSDHLPDGVTAYRWALIAGLVAVTLLIVWSAWPAGRRVRGELFQVPVMPSGWVAREELNVVVRALTRAATGTVGVTTDVLGRAGQAVEYDSGEFAPPDYRGATRTRLVIDPASGRPLSLEVRSAADSGLLTYTAIRDSRWADTNPLKEHR
ncbi:hypothetical protein GCM10027203_45090 [Nonomuraea fastidiosa]